MDRYSSSPALFDDLALNYTGAVGARMPNQIAQSIFGQNHEKRASH